MKLAELLPRKAVVAHLKAKDKKGAIRELAQTMKSAYEAERFVVAQIVQATMEREKKGSTGIGRGVGIPHTHTQGVDRLLGAFGRHEKGLDWSATDGEPVHLIFLILSPTSQPAEYQLTLKSIVEAVRRPNFCRFLRSARTAKEIEEVFREAEEVVRVP